MSRRAKTPEQLAIERAGKKAFTLYLSVSNMNYLKDRAASANVSASELVNEAISHYINIIKQDSSNKKKR